jgi:hypothetical protein
MRSKAEPLQKFDFQESPYERPNQKWVCGKKDQGCPCEIGPDKKGKCRADFECKPKASINGDQWNCTRSSSFGGNCTNGPLPDGTCCKPITPCYPVRSIKYKRSLAIKWVTIATLGILLFLVNGNNKHHFISPGELTYQHANNTECSDCHLVFDKGFTGWVHQALNSVNIIDSNEQCINCHELGEHADEAHGLSEAGLKKISNTLNVEKESSDRQQIACMTCHVEHHGTNNSLLAVNSQNCALCHDLPFKNGKKSHPEFRQYPYRRRTGIIFDHTQHYDKHFFDKSGETRKENAPSSCLTCHASDKNGIKMVVRDYQKTCSECHNSLFEESEAFPVITVPALDTENIVSLGAWPADADAELTPFMKLLLSNGDKIKAVLAELDGGDLTELEQDDAQVVAWSIKELFYDIYKQGDVAVTQRLAKAFNCQLNSKGKLIQEPACQLTVNKLDSLVSAFPYPLFCSAQKEWFPKLANEMKLYLDFKGKRKNILSASSSLTFCETINKTADSDSDSEAWMLDYFTLSYRPVTHADKFFSTWLNASQNHQGESLDDSTRKEIFELLNSEDSAGQCVYCHSVDTDNNYIHWSTPKWNPKRKDFIRFNHAGHLRHQEESVCKDCHKENKEADYLASYKNSTPLDFQSNFSTGKEQCETCHNQAMTEKQYQTCHNYHVSDDNDFSNQDFMGRGNLKVWADKKTYLVGDNITIKFSVDQAMYVRIVRIDSSGKILSLFPNDFRPDHYCKPGVTYQIPKLGSERTLTIEAPAGTDKLLGIGSKDPIPEDALFFNSQGNFDEDKMSEYIIRSLLKINVQEKGGQ